MEHSAGYLQKWSPLVQRWFCRWNHTDEQDRAHVLHWMTTLCEHRQAAHPDRIPERTFRAHETQLINIFSSLCAAATRENITVRDLLPFIASEETAVSVVAKCVLCWALSRSAKNNGVKTGIKTVDNFAKAFYNNLALGGRCLIFPRLTGLKRAQFCSRALLRVITQLCEEKQETWGALADCIALEGTADDKKARSWKSKAPITRLEVETLLQNGCKSPLDTVLVLLLATAAPRLEAIAGITVASLWDPKLKKVHESFDVLEKGSKTRRIVPRRSLREALAAFLCAHENQTYLFEFTKGRKPIARSVAMLLNRICRRARVRALNPHLFRSFVVNEGVKSGMSLQSMAKYIGHRDVMTTSRYYLSDDMTGIIRNVYKEATRDPTSSKAACLSESEDNSEDLIMQLVAAEEELKRLEKKLEISEELQICDQKPQNKVVANRNIERSELDMGLDDLIFTLTTP